MIHVYGPNGQIIESTELSEQEPYNDISCVHKFYHELDDDESIPGALGYKCNHCPVGWFIKEKIKES